MGVFYLISADYSTQNGQISHYNLRKWIFFTPFPQIIMF